MHAEIAANDPSVLHELGKDPLDHGDRDGEADALGGMNDGRVHADHPALRVEQRASAIARVERSVGLDHVIDQVPRDAAQGAAERTDDAGRHRRIKSERTADRDDELADPQAGRFAELGVRQPRGLGLNDGDVGPGVGPDDPAADFSPVIEPNPHPARAAARRGDSSEEIRRA